VAGELAQIVFGGLVATAAMTGILYVITTSGKANADMVRALGSLLTKSLDNAMAAGFVFHFLGGAFWAVVYTLFLTAFQSPDIFTMTVLGGALGLFHGVIFALAMVIFVAENHPVERFREAGPRVAVAHLIGHIVYGIVLGAWIGNAGITLAF